MNHLIRLWIGSLYAVAFVASAVVGGGVIVAWADRKLCGRGG